MSRPRTNDCILILQRDHSYCWVYPTLDQLLDECLLRSFSPGQRLANPDLDRYFREMKVREVLRLLFDDGWYLVATKGSHRQFKHPTKSGRVTVAGKPSDDLAAGTLGSILKQADLKQ